MSGGVRRAAWADLDPATLHDLVRLRVDVFVVEQRCPYPELDGRDTDAGTEHVWTAATGIPVAAYLRVLAGDDGTRRIGRVVTDVRARGRGLAARLVADVVARHGDHDLVLDAQSHLAGWYARLGFSPDGEEFVEDGIPHVPMRRRGGAATGTPHERRPGPANPRRASPDGVGEAGGMTAPTPEDQPFPEPAEPLDDPADDPDVLAASSQLDERDDPGALATDGLEADPDDDGWEPPDHPGPVTELSDAPTVDTPSSLDERLAEEEPERDPADAGRADAEHDLRET